MSTQRECSEREAMWMSTRTTYGIKDCDELGITVIELLLGVLLRMRLFVAAEHLYLLFALYGLHLALAAYREMASAVSGASPSANLKSTVEACCTGSRNDILPEECAEDGEGTREAKGPVIDEV